MIKDKQARQTKKYGDMANVGTSTDASLTARIGGVQHGLFLRFIDKDEALTPAATLKNTAYVDLITVELNGTPIVSQKGAEILMRELYYAEANGIDSKAGLIPIMFDSVEFASFLEKEYNALGMADISNMTITLKTGATNNPATAGHIKRIEVRGEYSANNRTLGQHRRLKRFSLTETATAFDITSLPFGKLDDTYNVIHIADPSGYITDVSVELDNEVIIDRMNYKEMQERCERAGRSAQAGYFHIDFNTINYMLGGLKTFGAKDFRLKVNASASMTTFAVLTETTAGMKFEVKK